jgi:hypothetical protein
MDQGASQTPESRRFHGEFWLFFDDDLIFIDFRRNAASEFVGKLPFRSFDLHDAVGDRDLHSGTNLYGLFTYA